MPGVGIEPGIEPGTLHRELERNRVSFHMARELDLPARSLDQALEKYLIGDEMAEWLVSLTANLMIASSRPTVGQGLSNLSSSER